MNISLVFCLLVVVVLMLCLTWILILHEKLKRQYEALAESFYRVQELNGELRGQRHDYLNHLQIVYGMMELQEYEELHDYLEPVYKDMMKVGKAIRTSIPAVNALLMAKMSTAEANGTDFYVEVKSDLKSLKVEPWELCKVLSNLIDNGITALQEKQGEREMTLDIVRTGIFTFFPYPTTVLPFRRREKKPYSGRGLPRRGKKGMEWACISYPAY